MASTIPIKNDAMLMAIVGNDLKKVIDDLSEWILTQIKESVWANVYMVGTVPEMYERLGADGGFLDAWKKEVTSFVGNVVSNTIGFDYTRMEYNPSKHQHGSTSDDRRADLARLIETGSGYDFGGNAAMARDFWSEIEKMVIDGSFDIALENFFRKHNISFIRR